MAIQKYFGSKNIIAGMRNQFSFHNDAGLLQKSLAATPNGFFYEILVAKRHRGHNIYYGSEMVIIDGVKHLKPHTSWEDAIDAAYKETTKIALLISRVFQRIIGSIMQDDLDLTLDHGESVRVDDGPTIDSVVIRFFCSPETNQKN